MDKQFPGYEEILKNTPGPISLSDLPFGVRYKDLLDYAQQKGVPVKDLSEEEKMMFVFRRSTN